jgi:hypothetical protein
MSGTARCANTERSLTRSLDLTEEGLAMQATRDVFTCEVCGKTRTRRPREGVKEFAKRRFCSPECATAIPAFDALEAKFCARCGKQLERKKYGTRMEPLIHFQDRKYCSRECACPNRKDKPRKRLLCKLGDGKLAVCHAMCTTHYTRWKRYGDAETRLAWVGDAEDRFTHFADRSAGPDGCHPWAGQIDQQSYGRMPLGDGSTTFAHIYAYEREHGPVPDGLELDHVCHDPEVCRLGRECPHRRCCNPRHVKAVPIAVNRARNSNRKLSDEAVRVLYHRRLSGEPLKALATQAGVRPETLTRRFSKLLTQVVVA